VEKYHMATRRPTLQLQKDEDASLRALYREFDIPTDQYPHRPEDLQRLVAAWNQLTGRNESPSDVLHYMISRRKKGKGERLGWNAGADFQRPQVAFTDAEIKHLDAIHEELQVASDNYAINPELAKRLQQEFARRAGRLVPPMMLAAAMISRRKAGALATLKPKSDDQDLGFSDIDQVAK
jgi:hypothetical protein